MAQGIRMSQVGGSQGGTREFHCSFSPANTSLMKMDEVQTRHHAL